MELLWRIWAAPGDLAADLPGSSVRVCFRTPGIPTLHHRETLTAIESRVL
jgi:hypothetical protein